MKDRPKILFLDHTAALGGAELALLRLLRHLDHRRFDPSVLLFSEGPLGAQLRASGIPVHVLPLSPSVIETSRYDIGRSLLCLRSVAATLGYTARLARFLRENRIDLVHTNSLKSDLIGGFAAVLARKRVLWHIHDRIASDYMPAPVVRVFRFLARTLPDYLIANSELTLRLLLPDSPRPCRVIYPGVRLADFTVAAKDAGAADPSAGTTIGLVGRISPTKGHDVFLRAAAQVLRRCPKTRFQIIGGAFFNDAEYEREVRALATRLGLDGQVEFTGFVEDVGKRIAKLDILVAPSTIPESFGQVVVEGMAAGVPVVASNTGGVPEIVADGETGLLVPPGDADRLAEAICRLIDHPDRTRRMAKRGREHVARRFTIERTARDVESVYEQLLGNRNLALVAVAALSHMG